MRPLQISLHLAPNIAIANINNLRANNAISIRMTRRDESVNKAPGLPRPIRNHDTTKVHHVESTVPFESVCRYNSAVNFG